MPTHPFVQPRGRFEQFVLDSDALRDNLLGDPPVRIVTVYLPEGYDDEDADYPLFVDLVGFTGSGLTHLNWKPFEPNVPQRVDRLVSDGAMGPVIIAFPDAFTSLGGNQYVNSPAMGRWADFLIDEMLPALESRFRVRPGPAHRAVFGKSSGGYGSIAHGLLHGQHWGAVACHSGDMGFDWIYRNHLAPTLDRVSKFGGVDGFLRHVEQARKLTSDDLHALMTLAMAATYDPDPEAPKGVRLPVDPYTCALDEERWARWLACDPVHLIDRADCQANLRSLRGIYLDCGSRDQYFIHYGNRQFVAKLESLGIAHAYDEYDDTHSQVDYRMDESLPFLYAALTQPK